MKCSEAEARGMRERQNCRMTQDRLVSDQATSILLFAVLQGGTICTMLILRADDEQRIMTSTHSVPSDQKIKLQVKLFFLQFLQSEFAHLFVWGSLSRNKLKKNQMPFVFWSCA